MKVAFSMKFCSEKFNKFRKNKNVKQVKLCINGSTELPSSRKGNVEVNVEKGQQGLIRGSLPTGVKGQRNQIISQRAPRTMSKIIENCNIQAKMYKKNQNEIPKT